MLGEVIAPLVAVPRLFAEANTRSPWSWVAPRLWGLCLARLLVHLAEIMWRCDLSGQRCPFGLVAVSLDFFSVSPLGYLDVKERPNAFRRFLLKIWLLPTLSYIYLDSKRIPVYNRQSTQLADFGRPSAIRCRG